MHMQLRRKEVKERLIKEREERKRRKRRRKKEEKKRRGRNRETNSLSNPVSELVKRNSSNFKFGFMHVRVPTLVSVTGMKVHVQTYCLCVSITVDSHRLDLHLTAASHYLHTVRAGELDIRQLDRWSLLLTLGFLQQEILSHDIATSQKSENS